MLAPLDHYPDGHRAHLGEVLWSMGRAEDARQGLAELDRRLPKIPAAFRGEARHWRNFAASAVEAAARA